MCRENIEMVIDVFAAALLCVMLALAIIWGILISVKWMKEFWNE